MFPQTQAQAQHTAMTQQQSYQMRYGCFAARIGADVNHKLGIDMPVEPPQYGTALNVRSATARKGGRDLSQYVIQQDTRQAAGPGGSHPNVPKAVKAGQRVSLTVEDISRYPDEAEHAAWICTHPECAGKRHASKRELLASHDSNKDLTSRQEKHMYYAVFEEAAHPGSPGRPEERDAEGKVTKKGVPGRDETPARVILLSDEE